MDDRCRETARGHFLVPDDPVLRVQHDALEDLFLEVPHARPVVLDHVLTGAERGPGERRLLVPPADLDGGLYLRGLCLADALDPVLPDHLVDARLCDAVEVPELVQELHAQIHGRAIAPPGPQNYPEQLRIREDGCPELEQPLPGTLLLGPLLDALLFVGHGDLSKQQRRMDDIWLAPAKVL